MYDMVIIGAGPAGSTLARLLGKKLKILVIDKRQLLHMNSKSNFEKCCGGLLAPDAQQMLAKFGLGIPENILAGPQLFTVRTIDIPNNIEQYYQRHYINVHREKFDKWLVSLIPPEVTVICDSVFKRSEAVNDTIKIQYIEHGKEHTIYTKILVGADGAFSTVRRNISPYTQISKTYISIQEYYKINSNLPYFSSIFDDDITDFYSWTIPKDDLLILGTAVAPKNKPYEKFMDLKKKLISRGFEFGPCVKRNGSYLLRPEKVNQIYLGKANILLIGEAAGWISPSSAEGLSYSFRSAYALANAILHGPDNIIDEYYGNTNNLRLNIKLKHLKSPLMYNTFLRKLIMRSGLMSMNMIDY